MSTVRILESDARPQSASPLFGRLPLQLRLLIYKFAFLSCYATAWFDHELCEVDDDEDEEDVNHLRVWILSSAGALPPRDKRFRAGQICFSHSGRGFSLLLTCRMVYVEAFKIYWETVPLQVARDPGATGCGLLSVCKHLPTAIKENLRHLRNIKLPIMGVFQSAPGDANWTPTLLRQFPNLASLEFTSMVLFGPEPLDAAGDLLAIPGSDNAAEFSSFRFCPFRVLTGESPAEYIERKIGVSRFCGVTIISRREYPEDPSSAIAGLITRWQYLNWTTGMVYQTLGTGLVRAAVSAEDGYQRVIRARQGVELDRDAN